MECIRFDTVKAAVMQLINDAIADFPVRHNVENDNVVFGLRREMSSSQNTSDERLANNKNVVTNITVAEPELVNVPDLGQ